jgi:hypothetical protein
MTKRIVILSLSMMCTFTSSSFAWFSRFEKNKGPHGYSIVRTEIDCFGTKIHCENPGYEACSTVAARSCLVGAKVSAVDQKAVDYAREQMGKGVKNGKAVILGKRVKWYARNSESQITVDD